MANTYLLLIDQVYIQPLQTPEVEVELVDVITRIDFHYEATSPTGGRLIASDIHHYIVTHFDKHYHPNSIYYLLEHMGFSWITSRSKHPKQSQKAQDDFKKIPNRNDP